MSEERTHLSLHDYTYPEHLRLLTGITMMAIFAKVNYVCLIPDEDSLQ